MADAGGTTTLVQIGNEGPYMKYILHNTAVTDGETIPFDITGSPVQAEDRVLILSVFNWTSETDSSAQGNALGALYDESNMHFTIVESGKTDESIGVCFIYIPQGDDELGSA